MSPKDIEFFPEILRPCITQVLLQQKYITGHSYCHRSKISFKNLRSGLNLIDFDKPSFDRIVLKIPYAGQHLQWTILFYKRNICLAPDFEFSDGKYDFDANTIEETVPSWRSFNIENENALVEVFRELIELYRENQVDIIKKMSCLRPYNEYLKLRSLPGVIEEDIDVQVKHTDGDKNDVNFMIKLNIDVSTITKLKHINKDDLYSCLRVTVTDSEFKNFGLTIDPNIMALFVRDYDDELRWSETEDTCLEGYVSRIIRCIKEEIKYVESVMNYKKEFITELIARFKSNIIEYDDVNFTKAVLLLEKNNNSYLFSVVLDENFPQVKPKVFCQSEQYLLCGSPLQLMMSYPYSPNWALYDKIQKAMTAILDNIDVFNYNASAVIKTVNKML